MRRILLTILFMGLSSQFVWADEKKLLTTSQKVFEGIISHTLTNGLKVYLKPVPGSPIVTTMMGYKVGACDEELDQTGLSHYLEHLLFKGTDKLLPGDIDRITQRNGGRNNAYTSEDMTVYHFDFAADRWLTALQIEADRMRNTRIDEKHEFEQEKGAVISELNGNEDQPWELEYKMILPLLFGEKSPYGHPVIGQKKHVADATAAIIKKHYDRWYHPNNAVLVVVGGFDPKEALSQIEKLFKDIPKANLPERKPEVPPPQRKETVRAKMESKFETPKLMMGFNTVKATDADAPPLTMVAHILSSGKTSRFYRKFVEELNICLDISADHAAGRYPGWFAIQAELYKNDLAKVEAEIEKELLRLAKEGPTEAELKRVRRSLIAAHVFRHEGVHELCDDITRGVILADLDYVVNSLPKLIAVTADDVKRVTQKYLVNQKPVVVQSLPAMEPKGGSRNPFPIPRIMGRKLYKEEPTSGSGGYALKDAKTVVLENGLKLILLENHRLPMVVAQAAIHKTKYYEPENQNGVAALLGDLLEEGTTSKTGEEIAQAIENVGGSLSVSSTGGSVRVISEDTELGLGLLFDCLMNPAFEANTLERKREQLLADLAEAEKKPEVRGSRLFASTIYGKHPLGRPTASSAVVKGLKANDLKAFHKQVFVPNNCTIALVGDFQTEQIIQLITKLTSQWKKAELPKLDLPEPKLSEKASETIITDPNAAQLHVFIGHLGIKRNNPDYYKLLVMDNVLGTGPGFTDRLSANLRDRQGLAYTVRAVITGSAGEDTGTLSGYIGTFPDKYKEVKEGFLKEFQRIRQEPATKQEVEDAKKYLTGSLPFSMITSSQVAGLLLTVDRLKLGENFLEDYRKGVESVTVEDVQKVAQKYLHPDKIQIIAVGAIDQNGKPLKKDSK